MRLNLFRDKRLLYNTETNEIYCDYRPCLECPLYKIAVKENMTTKSGAIDCKRAGIITAFAMLEHNIKELIKLL